jgi:ABC-type Na+ efflux pump permease subunit
MTEKRQSRSKRIFFIGTTLVALAAIVAAVVLVSRYSGAPETVARAYVQELLREPVDANAVSDTQTSAEETIDDVSTQIALDFLRARIRQGATHKISVTDATSPSPTQHRVALSVVERDESAVAQPVRLSVRLELTDVAVWRVIGVAVNE